LNLATANGRARHENPKSEIRNPKQIQIGAKREMSKTVGGRLSANFANFREFSGREILTVYDGKPNILSGD
jgi:hypothetical protein